MSNDIQHAMSNDIMSDLLEYTFRMAMADGTTKFLHLVPKGYKFYVDKLMCAFFVKDLTCIKFCG